MTRFVLRRPVSATLLILAVVVFGVTSVFGINLELLPDIDVPMLAVMLVYPGAAADSVEESVVNELETVCAGLSGLDTYTAYSYESYCYIMFSYAYGIDIDACYADLTRALDRASLPDEVQDPVIMELSLSDSPIVSIAAQSADSAQLLALARDSIEPSLKALQGVARVEISGGREDYIRVRLDEQAMRQYGMTIESVARLIGAAEFNVPAGGFTAGSRDVAVTVSAELESLYALQNATLLTERGSQIRLSDIADISITQNAPESISRYNGADSITIDVTKVKSANSIAVSDSVMEVIDSFAATHNDITFEVIDNAGDTILDVLMSVLQTLVIGAVLAMLIIFLFFGDFNASLIIGSSMPVSVLLSLCMMRIAGFTMHLMTGSALIIAIGMIVDNSIVVIENCFRYRKEGASYLDSAQKGVKTVLASIVASTITTCVVYLPLSVMVGLAGQFLMEFGFTIIFTMVSSLISAVTVVPLLFYKAKPKEKEKLPVNRLLARVTNGYKRLLPKLLKRNVLVVLVGVLLLAASVGAALTLKLELIPAMYDGSINVEVAFRPGTTLESIDAEIRGMEAELNADPYFEDVNMTISENMVSFFAYARGENERTSADAVAHYMKTFQSYTNMDITILAAGGNTSSISYFVAPYVEINLLGLDLDGLTTFSEEVKQALEQVPGVMKINSSTRDRATQARVQVDPQKAMQVGLTPAQVALDIYYTLSGIEVMEVSWNGREYAIKLEYPQGAYTAESALLDKPLTTPYGTTISLGDIAEVTYDEILQTRVRTDGKYQLDLIIIPAALQRETVAAGVESALAGLELPYGVSFARSTVDTIIDEEISALVVAILFGVFLVFLVMAIQFESPRFAFMVMVSIPFSLIGAFPLMVVTNTSISLTSMLGFLTLVGTVVNNGILFVDTANELKQHMSVHEALVQSGVIRLRPILMTTLTTIIAMIPMAFERTGNAGIMSGLAIVIMGGLFTSTLLILLFLPNFYLMIAGKKAATMGLNAEEKARLAASREE